MLVIGVLQTNVKKFKITLSDGSDQYLYIYPKDSNGMRLAFDFDKNINIDEEPLNEKDVKNFSTHLSKKQSKSLEEVTH